MILVTENSERRQMVNVKIEKVNILTTNFFFLNLNLDF